MQDSAPGAPTRPRDEALQRLLCTTLTSQDLHRMARALAERGGDDGLAHALGRGSVSSIASQLITLIHHRGVERELFEELLRMRPRQFTAIAAVARRFEIQLDPSSAAPTRSRRSSRMRPAPLPRTHTSTSLLVVGMFTVGLGAVAHIAGGVIQALLAPPPPVMLAAAMVPASLGTTANQRAEAPQATMPAVPLPPRPPEAACAHPEVHAASQEQSIELIVTSKRPRNRAELVTFPADLDSGDAARHVFLDHFLRGDPEQRVLFEGAAFKLCALDRCSGTGTSVASHVARAPPSPVRTTAPSRAETKLNLPAPLGAPSPPNARPPPPTVHGAPQARTPTPEVGFILMEGNQIFAKQQPRSSRGCTRWDEPCASTVRLPEGTRLGEFSFSLNLRFEAIDPATLSRPVQPYADDCWWRDEQPLLADASGACGDDPRFAVLITVDGGLRWIVEDGADAGPGRAWSIEAPAPHEGGVLDSRWHNITLVRRFGDDGDAALELWLDGALQGIEASSARTDLAPRWLDEEDHLRAPWSWSLAGDMGLMQLWERALDAHELEALRPASLLDLTP